MAVHEAALRQGLGRTRLRLALHPEAFEFHPKPGRGGGSLHLGKRLQLIHSAPEEVACLVRLGVAVFRQGEIHDHQIPRVVADVEHQRPAE